MLALAYASEHPDRVSRIVLIGCGTFDPASREKLTAAREGRIDDLLRRRMRELPIKYPDPDARLEAMAELMLPVYSHDLATTDQEVESFDSEAHERTWSDMVRLQEEGVFPAAFRAIEAPVLMLHGAVDPHPGRMIRDSLAPHIRRLEYRELGSCGHYPWMERGARAKFFRVMIDWLLHPAEGAS
jgi:pimeloyl-ACP methyl ester carboxylesterase